MILDVLIAGFVIALIDWNTGLHLTRVLKKSINLADMLLDIDHFLRHH